MTITVQYIGVLNFAGVSVPPRKSFISIYFIITRSPTQRYYIDLSEQSAPATTFQTNDKVNANKKQKQI